METLFALMSEDKHTKKVIASFRRLTELDSKVKAMVMVYCFI